MMLGSAGLGRVRMGCGGMRWDEMEWDGRTKAQSRVALCAKLGSHLRSHTVQPVFLANLAATRQPLPQLLSRCQNQERGSRQLLRRLAPVPSNLFPTSSRVGGGSTSPAGPHASHQPSAHPHSLLVCVVKSSQYSSPESVNSSVPCLLLLPEGCQVCCPLPQWVHLLSCLTLSAGKRRLTTSLEEVCLEEPSQLP